MTDESEALSVVVAVASSEEMLFRAEVSCPCLLVAVGDVVLAVPLLMVVAAVIWGTIY